MLPDDQLLMPAVRNGLDDVVALLLEMGAPVNAREGTNGIPWGGSTRACACAPRAMTG